MDQLKELIEKGIVFEDDFINDYLSVIKDEGFLQYFEGKQAEAKIILEKLIAESLEHKATLQNILSNIK